LPATPRSPASWDDLLAGLVRGDLEATHKLTALLTGHLTRTRAFDLRDSWADIIQEVLTALIALAQRGGLREPAALVRYALTVTQSKVSDWAAGTQRERKLNEALANDPRSAEHALSSAAPSADVLVDLGRMLEKLPPRQRRALEETYLRGRTYEQTAEALGLTLRQVKRLQLHGLARLRRELGVER